MNLPPLFKRTLKTSHSPSGATGSKHPSWAQARRVQFVALALLTEAVSGFWGLLKAAVGCCLGLMSSRPLGRSRTVLGELHAARSALARSMPIRTETLRTFRPDRGQSHLKADLPRAEIGISGRRLRTIGEFRAALRQTPFADRIDEVSALLNQGVIASATEALFEAANRCVRAKLSNGDHGVTFALQSQSGEPLRVELLAPDSGAGAFAPWIVKAVVTRQLRAEFRGELIPFSTAPVTLECRLELPIARDEDLENLRVFNVIRVATISPLLG